WLRRGPTGVVAAERTASGPAPRIGFADPPFPALAAREVAGRHHEGLLDVVAVDAGSIREADVVDLKGGFRPGSDEAKLEIRDAHVRIQRDEFGAPAVVIGIARAEVANHLPAPGLLELQARHALGGSGDQTLET